MLSRPHEKKRIFWRPWCANVVDLFISRSCSFTSPLFSAFSCLLRAYPVLFILSLVSHLQSILHVQYLVNERRWSFNFKIVRVSFSVTQKMKMTSFFVLKNALTSSIQKWKNIYDQYSFRLNTAFCDLPKFLECKFYDFSKCLLKSIINSRFTISFSNNPLFITITVLEDLKQNLHTYKKPTNGVSTFDGVLKCDQTRLYWKRRVIHGKEAEESRSLQ